MASFCLSYLTGPIVPAIFFIAVSRAVRAEACDISPSSMPPFNFFTNASSTEPPMSRRAAAKSSASFVSTEDCLVTVCVAEKALAARPMIATTMSPRFAVPEERRVSPVRPTRSHICSPAFFFLAFEFMAYIIPFLRRLGQRTVKTALFTDWGDVNFHKMRNISIRASHGTGRATEPFHRRRRLSHLEEMHDV